MCRLIDYMSFHLEENILWSQSILSNKMIKKTFWFKRWWNPKFWNCSIDLSLALLISMCESSSTIAVCSKREVWWLISDLNAVHLALFPQSITAALSHKPPDLRLSARVTLAEGVGRFFYFFYFWGERSNTQTNEPTCTCVQTRSVSFPHHHTHA